MKFTLEDLFHAYDFVEERFGYTSGLDVAAARSAVAEVARLSKGPEDMPAVIFFALVRRPDGMGEAWTTLPVIFANAYAGHAGFRLNASPSEMNALRLPVCFGEMSLDELRDWFRARMQAVRKSPA